MDVWQRLTDAGYESDGEPGPGPHYSEDYYGASCGTRAATAPRPCASPSSSGAGRIDHSGSLRATSGPAPLRETVAPLVGIR